MTTSPGPIAHTLTRLPEILRAPPAPPGHTRIRVTARALDGMLKEAIVSRDDSGHGWRFLCDEGPYLNGSDLAPPPLAYFAAGMAAYHAALLAGQGASLDAGFTQHTWYNMEGSALKGTMTGGAMPVEWCLDAGPGDLEVLTARVRKALARSGVEDLMANVHAGEFSLTANSAPLSPARARETAAPVPELPWQALEQVPGAADNIQEFVRKRAAVAPSDDPTHGAGASLRESQRRELHLETRWTPGTGGVGEMTVHLRQPLGSHFGFRARVAPDAHAPDGLDLLCAGIALCFLTQMGRYASITKADLSRYAVIQDATWGENPARLASLITHAYLDSTEDADACRRFLDMSEQTCFLHAATRGSNPTAVRIVQHT